MAAAGWRASRICSIRFWRRCSTAGKRTTGFASRNPRGNLRAATPRGHRALGVSLSGKRDVDGQWKMVAPRHPFVSIEDVDGSHTRQPCGWYEAEVDVPGFRGVALVTIRGMRFVAVRHVVERMIRADQAEILERLHHSCVAPAR